MNQQKTKKAGIMKYSLIVPLALALVLSSNAETLVNSAKKAFSTTEKSITTTPKETHETATTITPIEKLVEQELTPTVQNTNTIAQQPENKKIYTVVEKMPQFPGGEQALFEYINRHVRYPADAHQNGVQGKVIIRFAVNESGKVENAEIIRGIYPSIDAEGLKVVSSLPDFTPGEQNGKKVAVWYTMPITFRLDDGKQDKTATENWRKSLVIIVDGIKQPIGFDFKSIKSETIEKVDVKKPETEEQKAELIAKYGENAANGVIEITKKK